MANAAERVAEEVREEAHLAAAAAPDLARALHLLHADAVARGVVRPHHHDGRRLDHLPRPAGTVSQERKAREELGGFNLVLDIVVARCGARGVVMKKGARSRGGRSPQV